VERHQSRSKSLVFPRVHCASRTTKGNSEVRVPPDEVITATTARAEDLFDELVDTLVKEDDPIGVACSLLIQLTRFVAEAGTIAKELARETA
jgi:hypothetical protein